MVWPVSRKLVSGYFRRTWLSAKSRFHGRTFRPDIKSAVSGTVNCRDEASGAKWPRETTGSADHLFRGPTPDIAGRNKIRVGDRRRAIAGAASLKTRISNAPYSGRRREERKRHTSAALAFASHFEYPA